MDVSLPRKNPTTRLAVTIQTRYVAARHLLSLTILALLAEKQVTTSQLD